MSHRDDEYTPEDRVPDVESQSSRDEREIAELLREAGPRDAVPDEHLRQIRASVHREWRRAVTARDLDSARATDGTASQPELGERSTTSFRWLAMAAAVLLMVWVSWSEIRERQRPVVLGNVERALGAWATGGAERLALTGDAEVHVGKSITVDEDGYLGLRLASGHSVRVRAGSVLTLAGPRELALHLGTVYVDSGRAPVETDPSGGVTVTTLAGRIEEIGTRFEVAYRQTGLTVRVREGVVRWSAPLDAPGAPADESGDELAEEPAEGADGDPLQERYAYAGQQLSVDLEGRVAVAALEHDPDSWRWVLEAARMVRLEGRTVESVVEEVCGELGCVVRYVDAAARQRASTVLSSPPLDAESALAVALRAAELEAVSASEGGALEIRISE